MKNFCHAILCVVYCCVLSAQQSTQPLPPTQYQIKFIRHLLVSIGNSDRDPNISKMNIDGIVLLYGLNEQEAAAIEMAGRSFTSALTSFQRSRTAVVSGKETLTEADNASIMALSSKLDETVRSLASQILTSVRPERATLLRLQGDLLEKVTVNADRTSSKGGN